MGSKWVLLGVKGIGRHSSGTRFKSVLPGVRVIGRRYLVSREGCDAIAGAGEVGGNEEVDKDLKVVEYLNSLTNFEKVGVPKGAGTDSDAGFDLQRMTRLLRRLGDPLSSYPVVHVAGTKGKGSTAAFLSSILRKAGFCVGLYTSPHIQSLRERIVTGKTCPRPISSRAFNELFSDLHGTISGVVVAESGLITHFEVLTALAFAHFAREKVDLAVIEAGLGGARDATNVIEARGLIAAVIVGIGEEHLEALGGSLESIAVAKAGIIKPGRPVILGRQVEPLAERIVRQIADSKGAIVLPRHGYHATYDLKGVCADSRSPHQICDFSVSRTVDSDISSSKTEVWHGKDFKVSMLGVHQLDNAVTAIQTALCMKDAGWKIPDSAIRLGVESTVLPGRFQVVTPSEAFQMGSLGSTVILDGAHTVNSAAALASTLREYFPDECVAVVVAMALDKDHKGFARELLKGTNSKIVLTTRVDIAGSSKRSVAPSCLSDSFICVGRDLHLQVLTGSKNDGKSRQLFNGLPEVNSAELNPGFRQSSISKGLQRYGQLIVDEADCVRLAISKAAHLLQELNSSKPGVVCITGSLHVVAAAISLLGSTK